MFKEQRSREDELSKVATIAENLRKGENKFKRIYSRCKRDLEVCNGVESSQYSDRDIKVRGEDRAQFSFPVLDKFVEQICGNYNLSPFGIMYESNNAEANAKARMITSIAKGIENRCDAKSIYRNALRNIATFGYSWIHVTTDYDNPEDDSLDVSIKIEGISDYSSVIIDPLSVAPDGRDANWIAHEDFLSAKEAEDTYGPEVLEYCEGGLFESQNIRYSEEDTVPIVTYYSKEVSKKQVYIGPNGDVIEKQKDGYTPKLRTKTDIKCTKLVGNKIISEQVLDNVNIIPLIPVYGLPVYDEGEMQYIGIVHRAIDTQTLLNYAGSLTAERLALSPKANYMADIDAISPFMETWKNSSRSNIPVLPFRSYDPDQKRQLAPPMKQDTAVNVSDVTQLQSNFLSMVSSIVGMPEIGMAGSQRKNETAEAVLTRQKAQETILSTFYENLSTSIEAVGRVLLQLLASTYNSVRKVPYEKDGKMSVEEIDFTELDIIPSEYEISVTSGPLQASVRKENAQSLLSLISLIGPSGLSLLPEVIDNLDLSDDKGSIKQKVEMIAQQSLQGAEGMQAQQQVQQLSQQNQVLMQQLQVLQGELNKSQSSIANAQIKSQTDILKQQMANENRLDVERLKLQGDVVLQKSQAELDAEKAILDSQLELEQTFVEEQQRLNEAQAQIDLINKSRGVGY